MTTKFSATSKKYKDSCLTNRWKSQFAVLWKTILSVQWFSPSTTSQTLSMMLDFSSQRTYLNASQFSLAAKISTNPQNSQWKRNAKYAKTCLVLKNTWTAKTRHKSKYKSGTNTQPVYCIWTPTLSKTKSISSTNISQVPKSSHSTSLKLSNPSFKKTTDINTST